MNRDPPQFYLASASPRRRDLLASVGLCFAILPVEVDETEHPGEAPADYCLRLARAKAATAMAGPDYDPRSGLAVLAADTCVALDGLILDKPGSAERARATLGRLSGRTHDVFTAVALCTRTRTRHAVSRTRVTFKALSSAEMDRYCALDEPLDKAGGYAVQGAASAFVKRIEGSYTGVVGLPLFETRSLLNRIGIDWL